MVSYYTKLKTLWDELHGHEDITCGGTCEAAPKLLLKAEHEKTQQFLMGLDDTTFGTLH